MDWVSGELVYLLVFLLPGFLTAAIFHSLTSHRKPEPFERVVSALIFTILIQFTTLIVRYSISMIIELPELLFDVPVNIFFAVPISIILGLVFSYLSNHDILHKCLRLRWLRITEETSYPSEWDPMFLRYGSEAAIMLYLKQDYNLYGKLEEYPSDPKSGYFILREAEWITNEGKTIPLEIDSDAVSVLVPATEVKMVALSPMIKPENE